MSFEILQFNAEQSDLFGKKLAHDHRAGTLRGPGESDALMAARRAVQRLRDIGWCT